MGILVIAEHDNSTLNIATLNAVTAAMAIGDDIDILVAGENCRPVADDATRIDGIGRVLLADNAAYAHGVAENVAALIADVGAEYSHILAAATTNGKNTLPHASALLDVQAISEISAVIDGDTFKRPIYAGNLFATIQSSDRVKVMTVRTTAFEAAAAYGGNASIEVVDAVHCAENARFESEETVESDRPELTTTNVVVAGGRSLGSRENFEMLYRLADKLGAAVGATRAAVDAGFVSNDLQVGQTGKIVAPDLYIAVGVSGAIQHLAGMKDSKVIVAINTDEDAPIFSVADYGLVADLFQAIPELDSQLT